MDDDISLTNQLSGTYQDYHYSIKLEFINTPSLQGAFYMTLTHFWLSAYGFLSNVVTG